jgi:hypothetical protein
VEHKYHETQRNYQHVLEQLEAAVTRAKSTLELLANERLDMLLTAGLELKRQQEQLQWIEAYAQVSRY